MACGALDGICDYTQTNEPVGSIELVRAAGHGLWVHVCDSVPRCACTMPLVFQCLEPKPTHPSLPVYWVFH